MTAAELKALYERNEVHHVTMRNLGMKCWEGMNVYVKDAEGFRGYRHVGVIYSTAPDIEEAYSLANANRGVCVGSYEYGG